MPATTSAYFREYCTAWLREGRPPAVWPTPLPSALNLDAWEACLSGAQDADLLLDMFYRGAPLRFNHASMATELNRNHRSAYEHADAVRAELSRCVRIGKLVGPFREPLPGSVVSPIGVAVKHDGKVRVITDCLFSSVNEYQEDKHSFRVFRLAQTLDLLQPGDFLFADDLTDAFFLFNIPPDCMRFFCVAFDGGFYYYTALCFGGRHSPFQFDRIGRAIEHEYARRSSTYLGRYADDFHGSNRKADGSDAAERVDADEAYARALAAQEVLHTMLDDLGVEWSRTKRKFPAQVQEILGIIVDTLRMELRLSDSKLKRLHELLQKVAGATSLSKSDLESVVGSCAWVATILPAARPLLGPMYGEFKNLRAGSDRKTLSATFRLCLAQFTAFVQGDHWRGFAPIIRETREITLPAMEAFSDASGFAAGGFFDGVGFALPLSPEQRSWYIHDLEALALLLTILLFGPQLRGCKVVVRCDNSVVCANVTRGWSHLPRISDVLADLLAAQLRYQLVVEVAHIPGAQNTIADAASRLDWARYRSLVAEWRRSRDLPPPTFSETPWQSPFGVCTVVLPSPDSPLPLPCMQ